jgi:hypothetical protein
MDSGGNKNPATERSLAGICLHMDVYLLDRLNLA